MADHVKLGQLLDGTEQRDAIHVAIAPAIASGRLHPGERVSVAQDGRASTAAPHVGIVDPFLTGPIFAEDRFYVFLFPGTVTGMRHHWSHPAFDGARLLKPDKEASQLWIKAFASDIEQSYESLMDAAKKLHETGEWTYDNSETYKSYWDRFREFWDHYEVVTGDVVDCKDDCPYTCSC